MRPTLILSKYVGGFGNRFFLHVHTLATAMEYGFSMCNLTLHQTAHLFEGLWSNSWCRYPAPRFGLPLHSWSRAARGWVEWLAHAQRRHPGRIPGLHTWWLDDGVDGSLSMESAEFLSVCRQYRWINLQGWQFRAPRFVQKHREPIRAFMRFRRSQNPQLTAWLDESRAQKKTRVCLHVRMGDFRTWHGGRYFIDPKTYASAAHRIAQTETSKDLEFWVCSDELLDLTLFPPGTRRTPNRTLAEDFQLLTESDFILGGISTFSRAAAFLGGGKVFSGRLDQDLGPLESWAPGWEAVEG